MENVRKHRDIKRVTAGKDGSLVSEQKPNSNRNEKRTQIFMNKPVYLALSIFEISKLVIYDFNLWYDYVKPDYNEKTKLCYTDTDSFIAQVKPKDIQEDITKDAKKVLILQIMS